MTQTDMCCLCWLWHMPTCCLRSRIEDCLTEPAGSPVGVVAEESKAFVVALLS